MKFKVKKRCKYCAGVLNEDGKCTCATFIAEAAAVDRIEELKVNEKEELENA